MRSLLSIFFLFLFLFPVVEKEFHAWEHEGESHCAEHELTHLHEKEHDCSICDFTFEKADDFVWVNPEKTTATTLPNYFFYFSSYQPEAKIYFSHRGPPALV